MTVGFHRYFTHSAFKATRGLRVALGVVGSMAMQGPASAGWPTTAATTRTPTARATRTHRGCGTSAAALAKGFWHAHMGGLFDLEQTNLRRFAPDLLADPDIRRVDRLFRC